MKITDVTDITDFHRVYVHGRVVHISKHSLWCSSQDHVFGVSVCVCVCVCVCGVCVEMVVRM